ncbi:hypothetical protein HHK36_004698 [Tetracentron sinense]|uniref:Uncharacterized protein n=1 Tax=Tetracentron sinense TaxID=13715 RepID=A0A834ZJK4_TETSI|nr:hypothetical protein HHK36_004698 [Tetracentron sinense]
MGMGLSGLLSISSKFLPTIVNILKRLSEEARGHPTPEAPRPPPSLGSQSFRSQTQRLSPVMDSVPDSSVSSTVSSSESSSPLLTHRRAVNVEEAVTWRFKGVRLFFQVGNHAGILEVPFRASPLVKNTISSSNALIRSKHYCPSRAVEAASCHSRVGDEGDAMPPSTDTSHQSTTNSPYAKNDKFFFARVKKRFSIPESVMSDFEYTTVALCSPNLSTRVYLSQFEASLRFLLTPLARNLLIELQLTSGQMHLNFYRLTSKIDEYKRDGYHIGARHILSQYSARKFLRDGGTYYYPMNCSNSSRLIIDPTDTIKYWKSIPLFISREWWDEGGEDVPVDFHPCTSLDRRKAGEFFFDVTLNTVSLDMSSSICCCIKRKQGIFSRKGRNLLPLLVNQADPRPLRPMPPFLLVLLLRQSVLILLLRRLLEQVREEHQATLKLAKELVSCATKEREERLETMASSRGR